MDNNMKKRWISLLCRKPGGRALQDSRGFFRKILQSGQPDGRNDRRSHGIKNDYRHSQRRRDI